MEIYCFVYYCFFLLSIPFVFFAWEKGFLFSVSNISLIANIILVSIPGYFVALRALSITSDFNLFLFFFILYIISTLSPPIGIAIGKKLLIKKKISESFAFNNKLTIRTYLLGSFICVYSFFFYFYWFEQIPLIHLILNPLAEKSHLAFLRNALTHDLLIFHPNLPFVLRYWRLIMQQIGLIVFLVCYASICSYESSKKKSNKKFFIIFIGIVLSFNQLMMIEKAPIIYFIFLLIAIDLFYKKRFSYKKIAIISLLIPMMYIFFMGSSPRDSIKNALIRLTRQNEGIVEQMQLYDLISEKPLLFRNYRFSIWDEVFNKDYISLPNESYKIKYSVMYEKYNITGSTGNLHIFSLYTSFGIWTALFVYWLYFVLLGAFSVLLTKKCKKNANIYISVFLPLLAVYFYSISTGGITRLFQSSIFVDPNLIAILIIPFILGVRLNNN